LHETSNISPFTELVLDVHRRLSICGNEAGEIFLASEEFCNDVLLECESADIRVIHVEEGGYPYFRLPARGDALLGPRDEVIQIRRYVMNFGQGFYGIRAGYSPERKIWVVSGEAEWYSPLRLELARNEIGVGDDGFVTTT
jgi:hypothetical protein